MNMKKLLPFLVLVLLAIAAISLRRCNDAKVVPASATTEKNKQSTTTTNSPGLDRRAKLFFTKHAKCRMACRKITQEEVRDIFYNGKINYSKSDLDNAKGATYAVEGVTDDRQRVRIIFAPKQKHTSVVTVIDLENEHACPSC
jgi:hypothetical protein